MIIHEISSKIQNFWNSEIFLKVGVNSWDFIKNQNFRKGDYIFLKCMFIHETSSKIQNFVKGDFF